LYYTSLTDYLNRMEEDRPADFSVRFPLLAAYSSQLEDDLKTTLAQIDKTNFWEVLPVILGIDSKLVLLRDASEDIDLYGFSEEEVIASIERDYQSINREQCSFCLDTDPYESLIFAVK